MSLRGITYPTPVYSTAVNNNRRQDNQRGVQQAQQPMYRDPDGRLTTKAQAMMSFEGHVNEQNNAITAHEEAHRAASGPQAQGSPVYNTTSIFGHTLIIGGHQNVAVPAQISFMAAKPQIDNTIRAAQYTINGAEAPSRLGGRAGELSDADKAVAAQGQAVLSSARLAFGQRETIDARLQRLEGVAPDGVLKQEQIDKTDRAGVPDPKQKVVGERLNYFA